MTIITRPRTAKNRHTARARGLAGIPAASYIARSGPQPPAARQQDTAPLWLPGLHPAPAGAR